MRDIAAGAVVVLAALASGIIASGSPLALLRIPLEAAVALAIVAVFPPPAARRIAAVVLSLVFTAAIASAAVDRGFTSTVGQPFNVVSGWPQLGDAFGVLRDSTGPVAAVAILALVVLVTVAVVLAVAAALYRLAGLVRGHVRASTIAAASLGAAWLAVALTGAQLVPAEPVAAADTVGTVVAKTGQMTSAAAEQAAFERAIATDAYATTPASELLTGLRGKDVIIAFIESYGQVAVQGTAFSSGVDDVLRAGNRDLAASGYSERSAFLTSSTFGGISWLAHSTLQTGLWIDSQKKYDQVTAGDRFTLSAAFKKAGWRTVSDVPSDAGAWPIGESFYHYDAELNAENVGYEGPAFSYARIPDQYTWAYFQEHELSPQHDPVMAEIDFVSSHTPWTPLPHEVPWASIGDGSIFNPQPAEGLSPGEVWQNPEHVQEVYGKSVEYSMSTLFSFLTTYDNPNLVVIVLGDHQPAPIVSGTGANHEVPISIISKDPAVIDKISSWNWGSGMLPSPTGPLWRMDEFRDKFLAAYGH